MSSDAAAYHQLNRNVEQIAHSLKSMTRAMEAINVNLVSLIKTLTPEELTFVQGINIKPSPENETPIKIDGEGQNG